MTYKEKYQDLEKQVALALAEHNAIDKKLVEVNGFFDKKLFDDKKRAYKKWQDLQHELNVFGTYINNHIINPNDEIQ